MRRGRIFIFLALIIILGVAAVFFIQRFMSGGGTPVVGEPNEPAPTQAIQMTEVVVVAQAVQRGAILNETHLSMIEFPSENVLPDMFVSMESVVGRRARIDMQPGTVLSASMLAEADATKMEGSDAAVAIPIGKVAIPIPVDRLSSVAYALRPGDHVSVIASFMMIDVDTEFQSILPNTTAGVISTGKEAENTPTYLTVRINPSGGSAVTGRTELDPLLNELIYVMPTEQQRARLVTQIIMQDAIVLRYGEFSFLDLMPQEEQPQAATGEEGDAERENAESQQNPDEEQTTPEAEAPDIVTLIVSPQEAVAIEHLLKSSVQFTLVLRSSEDINADGNANPIDTEAVTFQYLLETYNIPVPAKLPYGLEPRFDNPAPVVEETENQ